jgi:hypothetical protein
MFRTAGGNVGIGITNPSTKLDVAGVVAINSVVTINFIELATPIILQVAYTNTINTLTALPAGIPTTATQLLADCYYSASISDHEHFVLTPTSQNLQGWNNTRGAQPSTNGLSNWAGYRTSILLYPGETDGFSSFYGLWKPSVIIPVSSSGFYINNYGNSNSSGYLYFVIKAYSLGS